MFGPIPNFSEFDTMIVSIGVIFVSLTHIWLTRPNRDQTAAQAGHQQSLWSMATIFLTVPAALAFALVLEAVDEPQTDQISLRFTTLKAIVLLPAMMSIALALTSLSGLVWGIMGRRRGHAYLGSAVVTLWLVLVLCGGAYVGLGFIRRQQLKLAVLDAVINPLFSQLKFTDDQMVDAANSILVLAAMACAVVAYWATLRIGARQARTTHPGYAF